MDIKQHKLNYPMANNEIRSRDKNTDDFFVLFMKPCLKNV